MHFEVGWDDPNQTVIVVVMREGWDWGDYFVAVNQTYDMIRDVNHKVDVIISGAVLRIPRGDMLSQLRKIRKLRPENMGELVLVGVNTFVRSIAGAFGRVYRNTVPVYFADSVREARSILKQARVAS